MLSMEAPGSSGRHWSSFPWIYDGKYVPLKVTLNQKLTELDKFLIELEAGSRAASLFKVPLKIDNESIPDGQFISTVLAVFVTPCPICQARGESLQWISIPCLCLSIVHSVVSFVQHLLMLFKLHASLCMQVNRSGLFVTRVYARFLLSFKSGHFYYSVYPYVRARVRGCWGISPLVESMQTLGHLFEPLYCFLVLVLVNEQYFISISY